MGMKKIGNMNVFLYLMFKMMWKFLCSG